MPLVFTLSCDTRLRQAVLVSANRSDRRALRVDRIRAEA